MSFSAEIKSNVKVALISAEQHESARGAKEEKSPTPKSGKKKVSFAKELLEYAPRTKMDVTQQAYDKAHDIDNQGQGKKRVMKLSRETLEQAARELGQVAARHKLKHLEREKEKLPEEERKNASFEVGPNKELPQLGTLPRTITPWPGSRGCISRGTTSGRRSGWDSPSSKT